MFTLQTLTLAIQTAELTATETIRRYNRDIQIFLPQVQATYNVPDRDIDPDLLAFRYEWRKLLMGTTLPLEEVFSNPDVDGYTGERDGEVEFPIAYAPLIIRPYCMAARPKVDGRSLINAFIAGHATLQSEYGAIYRLGYGPIIKVEELAKAFNDAPETNANKPSFVPVQKAGRITISQAFAESQHHAIPSTWRKVANGYQAPGKFEIPKNANALFEIAQRGETYQWMDEQGADETQNQADAAFAINGQKEKDMPVYLRPEMELDYQQVLDFEIFHIDVVAKFTNALIDAATSYNDFTKSYARPMNTLRFIGLTPAETYFTLLRISGNIRSMGIACLKQAEQPEYAEQRYQLRKRGFALLANDGHIAHAMRHAVSVMPDHAVTVLSWYWMFHEDINIREAPGLRSEEMPVDEIEQWIIVQDKARLAMVEDKPAQPQQSREYVETFEGAINNGMDIRKAHKTAIIAAKYNAKAPRPVQPQVPQLRLVKFIKERDIFITEIPNRHGSGFVQNEMNAKNVITMINAKRLVVSDVQMQWLRDNQFKV